MRAQHLPPINLRYWAGITLASVFGTNLGDFYAHESGLGIVPALGILAAVCAAVFVLESVDRAPRELYYWLVIILIRTGATNIADYLAYRVPIPELALNSGLIVLLAALALAQRSRKPAAPESDSRLPATGPLYWLAMLTAGVLGTVLGDVCEHTFGDGPAALGLSAALIGVLVWRRFAIGAFYWLIVAVARTAGTDIGDWLAENHVLNIGLSYATLLTGVTFVGVLALWRPRALTVVGGSRSQPY
jgi:uncharacterized membrane-anchored protein